jgi:hypothetical protein
MDNGDVLSRSGAENVGPAPFLTAKTLINVDSEEMNAVCVGCAGGFERVCWRTCVSL